MLERARRAWGASRAVHLACSEFAAASLEDYFTDAARQCEVEANGPTAWKGAISRRLAGSAGFFLLVSHIENGSAAGRLALAQAIRGLSEESGGRLKVVLCGAEHLAGLKFEGGEHSLLNTAEVVWWGDPSVENLRAGCSTCAAATRACSCAPLRRDPDHRRPGAGRLPGAGHRADAHPRPGLRGRRRPGAAAGGLRRARQPDQHRLQRNAQAAGPHTRRTLDRALVEEVLDSDALRDKLQGWADLGEDAAERRLARLMVYATIEDNGFTLAGLLERLAALGVPAAAEQVEHLVERLALAYVTTRHGARYDYAVPLFREQLLAREPGRLLRHLLAEAP